MLRAQVLVTTDLLTKFLCNLGVHAYFSNNDCVGKGYLTCMLASNEV